MATIIDIADAVAAELNAAPEDSWGEESFKASRQVLPVFELADLAELKVVVVPRSVEVTAATRSAGQYEYAVDIGVQKKLTADLDAEVAALCGLVERIGDYLRRRTLASAAGAVWAGVGNDPVYAREHLAGQRVFTSVLTVTYRVLR